jgi:hypothetical protein
MSRPSPEILKSTAVRAARPTSRKNVPVVRKIAAAPRHHKPFNHNVLWTLAKDIKMTIAPPVGRCYDARALLVDFFVHKSRG